MNRRFSGAGAPGVCRPRSEREETVMKQWSDSSPLVMAAAFLALSISTAVLAEVSVETLKSIGLVN
jgi:hypothetical protein